MVPYGCPLKSIATTNSFFPMVSIKKVMVSYSSPWESISHRKPLFDGLFLMVFLNVPRVFSSVLKAFKVVLDGSKCVCGGSKAVLVLKVLVVF